MQMDINVINIELRTTIDTSLLSVTKRQPLISERSKGRIERMKALKRLQAAASDICHPSMALSTPMGQTAFFLLIVHHTYSQIHYSFLDERLLGNLKYENTVISGYSLFPLGLSFPQKHSANYQCSSSLQF